MIYDAIIRKRIDSLLAARRYHRKVAIKIYWHAFPNVANVGGRCKIATLDSSLFTILLRDWDPPIYQCTLSCEYATSRGVENHRGKQKYKPLIRTGISFFLLNQVIYSDFKNFKYYLIFYYF